MHSVGISMNTSCAPLLTGVFLSYEGGFIFKLLHEKKNLFISTIRYIDDAVSVINTHVHPYAGSVYHPFHIWII